MARTRHFPEFVACYFPSAHAAIDGARPHVFLDEELGQLTRGAGLDMRLLDRLAHVEVQGWARACRRDPSRRPRPQIRIAAHFPPCSPDRFLGASSIMALSE